MKSWLIGSASLRGSRSCNEDYALASSWKFGRDSYYLISVSDGISQMAGSAECSRLAVESCLNAATSYVASRKSRHPFILKSCAGFKKHFTNGLRSMDAAANQGATVGLVVFTYKAALLGWAGDSRIYALMADGSLCQLTTDHHSPAGDITSFVRGNGEVIGGLHVKYTSMKEVVALIGTTDGVHERCSHEELRQFILYLIYSRMIGSDEVKEELEKFLGENLADNATLCIAHRQLSNRRVIRMAKRA